MQEQANETSANFIVPSIGPAAEEWRPIEGYGNLYEVSEIGNIRRKGSSRYLPRYSRYREPVVRVLAQKIPVYVAEALASAFLPKPSRYAELRYRDGNKCNIDLNNLYWEHKDEYVTEEWRPLVGHDIKEGVYLVSSLGRIKNKDTNKILKGTDKKGYRAVSLALSVPTGHAEKRFSIHRLVAEAFLDNPEHLPEIDHINGIRDDNRVENLRWSSRLDNVNNPITRKKFLDHMRSDAAREAARQRTICVWNRPGFREHMQKATTIRKCPVLCLRDGQICASLHEASRLYNIQRYIIKRRCLLYAEDPTVFDGTDITGFRFLSQEEAIAYFSSM